MAKKTDTGLVSAKEVAKVINIDNYGFIGTFIGWLLIKLLKISTLNKIYNRNKHLKDLTFLNSILDDFKIKFEIPEEDLNRLPKDGAYITISNHPLGGIDGILLLKLMLEQRQDFKIIANFLLHRIEPLKPYIMPVNPFEDRKDAKSSISGFKHAIMHLKEGHPLGIFPAGEVSRATTKGIKDPAWNKGFLNFAQNSNAPILPIFLDAKNSKTFYTISVINKTFSTLLLSHEMFNKKSKRIAIKVGQIIPNENITPKGIDKKFLLNLYKKHLYSLKKGKKSFFETQSAIAHPVSRIDLLNELKKSKLIGQTSDGKKIFL